MKFGQYELLERIAMGGMAEVYKGRVVGAEGFEKLVAIKRILSDFSEDERFVTMLLTEARIHSALSHRNIVQIHDLGISEEGEYFIVLEYVEGYDLRAIMESIGAAGELIPEALSLHIAAEVAQALHFAHELRGPDGQPLGLIHRDVSPSNVLISFAGEVKLSDFGLAKRRHDRSVVGSLKGNLIYMSPEQARQVSLDRRTDVFSLGAVLFELLTGEKLRVITDEIKGWSEVAAGVVRSARSVRPDLPESFVWLLEQALAVDPAQRFADAGMFGAAARQILAQMNTPVGPGDLQALLSLVTPRSKLRSEVERSKVIRLAPEVRGPKPAPVPERLSPAPIAGERIVPKLSAPGMTPAMARPTPPPVRPSVGDDEMPPTPPPLAARPAGMASRTLAGSPPPPVATPNLRAATPPAATPPAGRRPAATLSAATPAGPIGGARLRPRPAETPTPPPADAGRATPPGPIATARRGAPPALARTLPQRWDTASLPSAGPPSTGQPTQAEDFADPALQMVTPPPVWDPPPAAASPGWDPPPPAQPGWPQGGSQAWSSSPSVPALADFPPPRLHIQTAKVQVLPGRGVWRPVAVSIAALLVLAASAVHLAFVPLDVLFAWRSPAPLYVASEPEGAVVKLDGVPLSEVTPTKVPVRRDRSDHVVEIQHPGFRAARDVIRFDRSVTLSLLVSLQKEGGASIAPVTATSPASPSPAVSAPVAVPAPGAAAAPGSAPAAGGDTGHPVERP